MRKCQFFLEYQIPISHRGKLQLTLYCVSSLFQPQYLLPDNQSNEMMCFCLRDTCKS